jgi:hypothetical protein
LKLLLVAEPNGGTIGTPPAPTKLASLRERPQL